TQYFIKSDVNEWSVKYKLNNTVLTDTHTLEFEEGGTIDGGKTFDMSFDPGVGDPMEGAATLEVTFDYSIATQFGGGHNLEFQQNGYATGEYASMSIAADGSIVANYTN